MKRKLTIQFRIFQNITKYIGSVSKILPVHSFVNLLRNISIVTPAFEVDVIIFMRNERKIENFPISQRFDINFRKINKEYNSQKIKYKNKTEN